MQMLKLYKYQSNIRYAKEILESNRIWFSKPKNFNDPYDCGLDLSDSMSVKEQLEVLQAEMLREGWSMEKVTKQLLASIAHDGKLNELAQNNLKKLRTALYEKRDNVGVLCLGANCKSTLMWSHYAACHRGIAIEFSANQTDKLHKVDYQRKPPQYTLHDIHVKKNSDVFSLFITKHINWRYEREYRIVMSDGDRHYAVPGTITAIIFGMRTSVEDRVLLVKASSHLKNVEFRECQKKANSFDVSIANF